MKYLFTLILIFCLLINALPTSADSLKEFDTLMNDWDEKINLASKYLDNAEKSLKNGDALQACSDQSKASQYGIEGTQSLIKAFKISGTTKDLSDLESGLEKWSELGDFCG